jgi:hypothetical protein
MFHRIIEIFPRLAFLLAVFTIAITFSQSYADIWECTEPGGGKRFDTKPTPEFDCKQLTSTPPIPASSPSPKPLTTQQIATFRNNIKIGDHAALGLVIEVKKPIAKLQLWRGGERWFQIDQLAPYQ